MSIQFCSQTCPLAKGECVYADVECSGKVRLERALQKFFKFDVFRPGQLESLLPLVHGRDVFTRMATGAGKSLCMYLAPLALGESAVGVVISPLNALMEQQVQVFLFPSTSLLALWSSDSLIPTACIHVYNKDETTVV